MEESEIKTIKTLENDECILVFLKGGGSFNIHELQLEGKSVDDVFVELMKLKSTGGFYENGMLFVDTGQIVGMVKDKREYLNLE